MDLATVRRLFYDEFENGVLDPYVARDNVFPLIPEEDYRNLLYLALANIAREALRHRRNAKSPLKSRGGASVYVPMREEWVAISDLTAEECDNVALDYEIRAEKNLFYAQQYRNLAHQIRSSSVHVVGELESYRAWVVSRQQEGRRRAKEDGLNLGSPVKTSAEVTKIIVRLKEKEHLNCVEIAQRLTEAGIPTPMGKSNKWVSGTVRRVLVDLGFNTSARKSSTCRRGHEWTEENTYKYPDGRRGCRTCISDYNIKHGRKKAKA